MDKSYDFLYSLLDKESIKLNEPMKNHTTVRVGGNCDAFVTPSSISQIVNVIKELKNRKIKYYVIGNGSNLLVSDENINAVIINLGIKFSKIDFDGNKVTALSGCAVPKLALEAKKKGLSGLEFACGVPGTVGGAVFMNAGCYGSDFSQIVEEVTYLDKEDNIKTIKNKDIHFGYRESIFKDNKDFVILSATFKLEKADISKIEEKMKENSLARRTKQPLEYPNFGSTFKRPEGYFVGKLIQDAGLRGYKIGGAQVSEKHTGFIVNVDNASCRDIIELIRYIQKVVYEKFEVKLEPEVEFIGGEKI